MNQFYRSENVHSIACGFRPMEFYFPYPGDETSCHDTT